MNVSRGMISYVPGSSTGIWNNATLHSGRPVHGPNVWTEVNVFVPGTCTDSNHMHCDVSDGKMYAPACGLLGRNRVNNHSMIQLSRDTSGWMNGWFAPKIATMGGKF